MASFIGTKGDDLFKGLAGEADEFRFKVEHLGEGDVVQGGGSGPNHPDDMFVFTSGGYVNFRLLPGVSGIERFVFSADGNFLDITHGLISSARTGVVEFVGGEGHDWIRHQTGFWDKAHDLTAADRLLVRAGGGNDGINGSPGPDTLYGEAGNDSLWGGGGKDLLFGGEGNDTLSGADGSPLDGGAGDDLLIDLTGGSKLTGGEGNDSLDSRGGGSTLDGGDGVDWFVGRQLFADCLYQNIEGLIYRGGLSAPVKVLAQFDTIVKTIPGRDGYLGLTDGRGFDFSTLKAFPAGMQVSASAGRWGGMEITAGKGRIFLRGSEKADTLTGSRGDDSINGGLGSDLLFGGDGDDRIDAGLEGADTVYGEAGNDTIDISRVDRDLGARLVLGGDGNDLIRANLFKDYAKGHIDGGAGVDTVECRDRLGELTFSDVEVLKTNRYSISLHITPTALMSFETVQIWRHKTIYLTEGGTVDFEGRLAGNFRSFTVTNRTEESMAIHGTEGNERLWGGSGRDTLDGRGGDDQIGHHWTLGRHLMLGGAGNDTIYAGSRDTVDGGAGDDVVRISSFGSEPIRGGEGYDRVEILGHVPNSKLLKGFEAVSIGFSSDPIHFDVQTLGRFQDIQMQYPQFVREIRLTNGGTLDFDGTTTKHGLHVTAGPGKVALFGTARRDTLEGGARHDTLDGRDGADSLSGKEGSDLMRGGGGNDTIRALSGNDTLVGDAGDDELIASAGNNRLVGGAGRDWLIGGPGNDTYVFTDITDSGRVFGKADYISSYELGNDSIDLSAIDADPTRPGDQAFSLIGGKNFTAPGQIRVQSVALDVHHTIVELNVNADPRAEMMIVLRGNISLDLADFIL